MQAHIKCFLLMLPLSIAPFLFFIFYFFELFVRVTGESKRVCFPASSKVGITPFGWYSPCCWILQVHGGHFLPLAFAPSTVVFWLVYWLLFWFGCRLVC
jgi:hypothetical protein